MSAWHVELVGLSWLRRDELLFTATPVFTLFLRLDEGPGWRKRVLMGWQSISTLFVKAETNYVRFHVRSRRRE